MKYNVIYQNNNKDKRCENYLMNFDDKDDNTKSIVQ